MVCALHYRQRRAVEISSYTDEKARELIKAAQGVRVVLADK
jgi:hypothetical protein